jgi:chromosome partitioning protein
MAKVISIIQEKGGTGKSTIATNLAGMAAKRHKVALVDCDMPQGTSQSWASIRLATKPENLTARTATSYTKLVRLVDELIPNYDLIVIDAPPRIAEITKAALILSTLTLIPLGASAAEIWAITDLLNTIKAAKQINNAVNARILWNRFRASTNSAKELSETVRAKLNLRQLNTKLGYRVAYSEALARGLTVLEWTDKLAQFEMLLLGDELNKILKIQLWSQNSGKKQKGKHP